MHIYVTDSCNQVEFDVTYVTIWLDRSEITMPGYEYVHHMNPMWIGG